VSVFFPGKWAGWRDRRRFMCANGRLCIRFPGKLPRKIGSSAAAHVPPELEALRWWRNQYILMYQTN
jgi:hypothetical protein